MPIESDTKMNEALPPGASEASIQRYQLARALALRCPAGLGQEIALTGSASRGVSDQVSDIEINFWAEQMPTVEQQLTWLHAIGATDLFPNVATEADGSIMTTFTYQSIIVEAEWQTLAQQEQVLQTLLAAQSDSQWLILNGEMITSAVPLRTDGVLAHWKQMVADYPDAMIARVVASASEGWIFRHWVDLRWAYIERHEFLALQRTIDNDLANALRILWTINRQWGPQLKWVRHSAPALKVKPERLVERIEEILTVPPDEAVIRELNLVLEVLTLVPPSIDVSKAVNNVNASLEANYNKE